MTTMTEATSLQKTEARDTEWQTHRITVDETQARSQPDTLFEALNLP